MIQVMVNVMMMFYYDDHDHANEFVMLNNLLVWSIESANVFGNSISL